MKAITFGRYNIVTNAHLDTVKSMLRKWDNVVVAIVLPNKDENFKIGKWKEFYNMCDKNHEKPSEYSIEDRCRMWENTIKEQGLSDRVEIIKIARPEYFAKEFNAKFNKNEYQLVFPCVLNSDTKFDIMRNSAFEYILDRKIEIVYPQVRLHTSQIRKNLTSIKDWGNYVPKGTYEVIKKYSEVL